MKKYLDVEEIKKWFSDRETGLVSLDGSVPRWSAGEISENLDNMEAASPEPEQKYIDHVDALLDLVDHPLGMVDCRHTRGVIEDAANAFAVMIFEMRRLKSEIEELQE